MEKIDNARRAEVLRPLSEGQLEKMNRVVSREFIYIEGEVTGDASRRELFGSETAEKAEAAAKVAKEAAEEAGKRAVAEAERSASEELEQTKAAAE